MPKAESGSVRTSAARTAITSFGLIGQSRIRPARAAPDPVALADTAHGAAVMIGKNSVRQTTTVGEILTLPVTTGATTRHRRGHGNSHGARPVQGGTDRLAPARRPDDAQFRPIRPRPKKDVR